MLDPRRDHPAHRKFHETIRRELFFLHAINLVEIERGEPSDLRKDELIGLLVDAMALVPSVFARA